MEINIKRSARKSVAIKVTEKGEVFVMCPFKYSLKNIQKIVEEKKEWIQKAVAKVECKKQDFAEFLNYSKLYFLGKETQIETQEKQIIVLGKTYKKTKNTNIKNIIKDVLIKEANRILIGRLEQISNKLNINYNTVKIISARKKWGSCDSRNNISLNFRLIMCNPKCIDYVIVHELCHIKEFNHSKQFWNLVNSFVDSKSAKAELSAYSICLQLF